MTGYVFFFLNAHQQVLYHALSVGLSKHIRQIAVPYCAPAEINTVLKAVLTDTPSLFRFEGKWSLLRNERQFNVLPAYTYDQNICASIQDKINGSSAECLRMIDVSMDQYVKTRQVYDWFLSNVQYDLEQVGGQSVCDALVKKKAVCKGLSKGFQYILAQVGIFSTLQEGSLDGKTKHVWNVVEIDGQYYNVDVSMGYDCFSFLFHGIDRTNPYRCFAISDDSMKKTHYFHSVQWPMPICQSDYIGRT